MANVFLAPTDMALLMRGHRTAGADAAAKDRRFAVREAVMAKVLPGVTVTIWGLCADLRTQEIAATFTEVAVACGELCAARRLVGNSDGYRRA